MGNHAITEKAKTRDKLYSQCSQNESKCREKNSTVNIVNWKLLGSTTND